MLFAECPGEVFFGIEAVSESGIRHGSRFVHAHNNFRNAPFSDVVGRCESDDITEQADEMVLRIPRTGGENGNVHKLGVTKVFFDIGNDPRNIHGVSFPKKPREMPV